MKKAVSILILLVCLTVIADCNFLGSVKEPGLIQLLPEYKNVQFYRGKGFQDYTQFGKYYYDETVIKFINKEQAMLYVKDKADVSKIINYFQNFKKWIENEDFKDKYDFNMENVTVGDYFYITNNYPNEDFDYNPEKYPTYNVYWFDTETLTMYFIHNNI